MFLVLRVVIKLYCMLVTSCGQWN